MKIETIEDRLYEVMLDAELSLAAKGAFAIIHSICTTIEKGTSVNIHLADYTDSDLDDVTDALIELNEKGYTYVI